MAGPHFPGQSAISTEAAASSGLKESAVPSDEMVPRTSHELLSDSDMEESGKQEAQTHMLRTPMRLYQNGMASRNAASSSYFVTVVPPADLPTESLPRNGGHPSMARRGTLLPLYPTLGGQLYAIAREYGLPSVGGLSLYLLDDGKGSDGPRIGDATWAALWSGFFEDEDLDETSGMMSTDNAEVDSFGKVTPLPYARRGPISPHQRQNYQALSGGTPIMRRIHRVASNTSMMSTNSASAASYTLEHGRLPIVGKFEWAVDPNRAKWWRSFISHAETVSETNSPRRAGPSEAPVLPTPRSNSGPRPLHLASLASPPSSRTLPQPPTTFDVPSRGLQGPEAGIIVPEDNDVQVRDAPIIAASPNLDAAPEQGQELLAAPSSVPDVFTPPSTNEGMMTAPTSVAEEPLPGQEKAPTASARAVPPPPSASTREPEAWSVSQGQVVRPHAMTAAMAALTSDSLAPSTRALPTPPPPPARPPSHPSASKPESIKSEPDTSHDNDSTHSKKEKPTVVASISAAASRLFGTQHKHTDSSSSAPEQKTESTTADSKKDESSRSVSDSTKAAAQAVLEGKPRTPPSPQLDVEEARDRLIERERATANARRHMQRASIDVPRSVKRASARMSEVISQPEEEMEAASMHKRNASATRFEAHGPILDAVHEAPPRRPLPQPQGPPLDPSATPVTMTGVGAGAGAGAAAIAASAGMPTVSSALAQDQAKSKEATSIPPADGASKRPVPTAHEMLSRRLAQNASSLRSPIVLDQSLPGDAPTSNSIITELSPPTSTDTKAGAMGDKENANVTSPTVPLSEMDQILPSVKDTSAKKEMTSSDNDIDTALLTTPPKTMAQRKLHRSSQQVPDAPTVAQLNRQNSVDFNNTLGDLQRALDLLSPRRASTKRSSLGRQNSLMGNAEKPMSAKDMFMAESEMMEQPPSDLQNAHSPDQLATGMTTPAYVRYGIGDISVQSDQSILSVERKRLSFREKQQGDAPSHANVLNTRHLNEEQEASTTGPAWDPMPMGETSAWSADPTPNPDQVTQWGQGPRPTWEMDDAPPIWQSSAASTLPTRAMVTEEPKPVQSIPSTRVRDSQQSQASWPGESMPPTENDSFQRRDSQSLTHRPVIALDQGRTSSDLVTPSTAPVPAARRAVPDAQAAPSVSQPAQPTPPQAQPTTEQVQKPTAPVAPASTAAAQPPPRTVPAAAPIGVLPVNIPPHDGAWSVRWDPPAPPALPEGGSAPPPPPKRDETEESLEAMLQNMQTRDAQSTAPAVGAAAQAGTTAPVPMNDEWARLAAQQQPWSVKGSMPLASQTTGMMHTPVRTSHSVDLSTMSQGAMESGRVTPPNEGPLPVSTMSPMSPNQSSSSLPKSNSSKDLYRMSTSPPPGQGRNNFLAKMSPKFKWPRRKKDEKRAHVSSTGSNGMIPSLPSGGISEDELANMDKSRNSTMSLSSVGRGLRMTRSNLQATDSNMISGSPVLPQPSMPWDSQGMMSSPSGSVIDKGSQQGLSSPFSTHSELFPEPNTSRMSAGEQPTPTSNAAFVFDEPPARSMNISQPGQPTQPLLSDMYHASIEEQSHPPASASLPHSNSTDTMALAPGAPGIPPTTVSTHSSAPSLMSQDQARMASWQMPGRVGQTQGNQTHFPPPVNQHMNQRMSGSSTVSQSQPSQMTSSTSTLPQAWPSTTNQMQQTQTQAQPMPSQPSASTLLPSQALMHSPAHAQGPPTAMSEAGQHGPTPPASSAPAPTSLRTDLSAQGHETLHQLEQGKDKITNGVRHMFNRS
ncbi:hypothetical protein ACI68E_003115 [Malassezia pachydermatis]